MAELQTLEPVGTSSPGAAWFGQLPKKPRRAGRVTAPRRDQRKAASEPVGWAKPWLWRIAALVLVSVAFLFPRLSEVDRLVTPDEPIWLARSANFYEAIASGDLGSTYQYAHPGVTVMWLGAAGYWWEARDYSERVDGQISQRQNRIALVLEQQGRNPLDVLVAARQALILGMGLAFVAAFLMTLRLIGFWEATLGFLLIALEPYTIGITRLLHVDGLASVLMLLSVVAGLVYLLRGKRRSDLVISGVAAGLAVLTRSQMGIVAVWFVLILGVDAIGWRPRRPEWRSTVSAMVRPTAIWGGAAALTCMALWPAVWVDPIKVLKGMFDFAETAAIDGHERAVFFAGFVYEGDPGWRFYPATFIWRATPVTVAGLVLAVLAMVLAKRWKSPVVQVRIMLGLFAAMACYGLLMSIAAKKFDRYLLPVYPLAALAAAWGLLVLARRAAWAPGPRWQAGNNRELNGPPVGETYYRRNASGAFVAGTRPDGISNNDAYDIMSTVSNAKNILVVGAVNPVSVYSSPKDVALTTFSSWGPTDDGRIKPDIVTDGVNVLSPIAAANNAYDIYTGTSMSSPAAAGSLLLLQEYYSRLHPGTFMRSATLRGLAIHTALEAGPNPGPDYQFGWGLLNMEQAAAVITANNTTHLIRENVLNNGGTFSLPVIASGNGTLRATICWTDVKGTVEPEATALDNTNKKLVNDLDLVIKKGATIYRTWTLNPSAPANAATRANNSTDNVEKVELPDIVPGETYTIEITHKGTLARGSQAYSLIVSGVSSQPYCASAATSTAGAKIDSVSFNKIRKKNIAGCTSYNNYTTLTDTIETNQTLPLFVRLRSCDATSADKIVKAYLDFNNDGDFADAGENIATSAVISGDGDFTSNITLPASLTTGTSSILRIVMQETNSAAAVTPCGNYARGETQDYKVYVAAPSTDVGVIELMSPSNGECPSLEQYVAVRIRNFGRADKTNIPVSVEVKKGAAVVSNLSATFTGTVAAGEDAIYTFQAPMAFEANSTYTFTSSTSLSGDQKPGNNQSIATVAISGNSAAPAGTAVVCNNNVLLRVSPATSDLYTWYNTATATTPIATGTSTSTTTMASTYYLAKNDVSKRLGPADKLAFPNGGYLQFDANEQVRLIFDATQPVLLDKARMYIGHAGKVKFFCAGSLILITTTDPTVIIPRLTQLIPLMYTLLLPLLPFQTS